MKKIMAIVLVSLLGFLGCSSSDAGTSAVTVQAFGLVDEYGLSFTAHVKDQEGNLLSDAMLTINGEPMNIGFFVAEDMNMDQDDDLPDAIDLSVKGGQCGDYQPYYFLDFLDVNEGDTVEFVAKRRQCSTLYTSSDVVPEKIRIIEPSGDEPLPAGEPLVVRWEGGAPCSQFHVIYYRGSDGEMFSAEVIHGSTEFVMPESWTDEGWGVVFVEGCFSVDGDSQGEKESNVKLWALADVYIDTIVTQYSINARIKTPIPPIPCFDSCERLERARRMLYNMSYPRGSAQWKHGMRYTRYVKIGCAKGCKICKRQ